MTNRSLMSVIIVGLLSLTAARAHAVWPGDPGKCKADAVKAGSVCVDKYEASVWQIPATNLSGRSNAALILKVQNGTATLANLMAGGATQISAESNSACAPAFPATFPDDGQWELPLYAVSIPNVQPTACVTWFQAQQACGNSRKRLPTNAEWQLAVAGTPDQGADDGLTACNTANAFDGVPTGSRSGCISNSGAFDMVGNVGEWVADWVPLSTACPGWGGFSGDFQCFAGANTTLTGGPGALVRGGDYSGPSSTRGPLAVDGHEQPSLSDITVGFRCAR